MKGAVKVISKLTIFFYNKKSTDYEIHIEQNTDCIQKIYPIRNKRWVIERINFDIVRSEI
jgi:hypothetical protein